MRGAVRGAGCAVVVALTACSTPPTPEPSPLPAPAPEVVVAPAPAAAAVAGSYRLEIRIESGNRPQPRNRRAPQASMSLGTDSALVRAMAAPQRQYGATVTVPGYSRPARRGRAGQNASWWPVAGDSVVVQFQQGPQTRGEIQLRGARQGTSIAGEIWYVATETGAGYQLGTFTGTKSR